MDAKQLRVRNTRWRWSWFASGGPNPYKSRILNDLVKNTPNKFSVNVKALYTCWWRLIPNCLSLLSTWSLRKILKSLTIEFMKLDLKQCQFGWKLHLKEERRFTFVIRRKHFRTHAYVDMGNVDMLWHRRRCSYPLTLKFNVLDHI